MKWTNPFKKSVTMKYLKARNYYIWNENVSLNEAYQYAGIGEVPPGMKNYDDVINYLDRRALL